MWMSPVFERFAEGTRLHGVPRAIRPPSLLAKIVWMIVWLVAVTMFCVQLSLLLQRYLSHPKKVSSELVASGVPFPAISLCNMRNLDPVVLNQINHIFKNTSNHTSWSSLSHDPFVRKYMAYVTKYYPLFRDPKIDVQMFNQLLTRTSIATNINQTVISQAGVLLNEFIATCHWNGQACNRKQDFKQFFDPYYYNCFTFVLPQPGDQGAGLAEGLSHGLSTVVLTGSGMLDMNEKLRTLPGTHEHFSPLSGSEGVRVVIHPPNTNPYPHTQGFDVAPGYSTSFGIKARENIRMPEPHGNCAQVNPFKTEEAGFQYRMVSCHKHCLQRAVVMKCHCKDINLPVLDKYAHLPFCSDDSGLTNNCSLKASETCRDAFFRLHYLVMCAHNTSRLMSRNATYMRSCHCLPPCQEHSYDISYSLSRWPSQGFDGDEAYIKIFNNGDFPSRIENEEKFQLYAKYFHHKNRREAMKDFARINVYMSESHVLRSVESADYPLSELLSHIGGQAALWLGISIITLAEVCELAINGASYITRRSKSKSTEMIITNEAEMDTDITGEKE